MADTRTAIQARYDAKNRKPFSFKLHLKYDADIIKKLESVESMSGYIKQLIREDIARTCSVPVSAPKTYHIKPEYLDMWEGGDTPSDPDRIITEDDIRTYSEEWDIPVSTLLEQLEQID